MPLPAPAIFSLSGLVLTENECVLLRQTKPAGIILFARNIVSPEQVKKLIGQCHEAVETKELLVTVDQEGGRVARLKPPHWPSFPPVANLTAMASQDMAKAEQNVYDHYAAIGNILKDLGFNTNCAPVLDIPTPGSDAIVGDRAFSDNPERTSRLAEVACRALEDQHIWPVLKHIPGHGRATVDSHKALPTVHTPLEELEKTDFVPFFHLRHQHMAMTAHICYTALDAENCATFSAKAIHTIRHTIGFDGLLMSDDLAMEALSGSLESRASRALAAGCDIVLHCTGKFKELETLADHLPAMSNKAAARWKNIWKSDS